MLLLVLFLAPTATFAWDLGPDRPPPLATQVVDAETGEPIEGAVVLAYWTKCYASLGGWAGCKFSDAEETVTGPDGRYAITRRWTYEIPLIIQVNGPHLVIFKAGYGGWQRRQSGETEVMALPPVRTREERELAYYRTDNPGVVPREYRQHLQRALDQEARHLGYRR
jgi:hypothetical protein